MSTKLFRYQSLQRNAITLLILCMVSGMTGCVTSKQVEQIVAESNLALMQSIDAGISNEIAPSTTMDAKSGDGWKAEVERIEALIAAHAEQKAMINALRLRQAWILTVYRQDNLAKAAYDLINASELHTQRDLAIYALQDDLIWRFKLQGNIDTVERAEKAVRNFDQTNDALPREAEIRQYLEEMRAWINYMLANDVSNDKAKPYLEDGLNRFADSIPDAELKWIQKQKLYSEDFENIKSLHLFRLHTRTIYVAQKYREKKSELGVEPDWSDEKTQQLLSATSP